jgi:hypothetical protein
VRETLDFGQPIALLMNAVVQFLPPASDPKNLIKTLINALPPGSYVAASHATSEYGAPAAAASAYARSGVDLTLRDGREFADLVFDGLKLMPPGVVVLSEWHPDPNGGPVPSPAEISINAGLARKQ